jgi:hypothetical protein
MKTPAQRAYADERTRTSTGLPPHGPEPCASTSSATSAWQTDSSRLAARPIVALFDHREVLEVALDARGEVVLALAFDHGELPLSPRPCARGAGLAAEARTQPRPLRRDDERNGEREHGDREDAHAGILEEPSPGG